MSRFKSSRRQRITRAVLDAIQQAGRGRNVAALATGALALVVAGTANAQSIQYLEYNAPPGFSVGTYPLFDPAENPSTPTLTDNYSSTGEMGPDTFLLPNYGTVQVTLTPYNFNPNVAPSAYTGALYNITGLQNKSAGPYSWTNNADVVGINNLNPYDVTYGLTFSFNSSGPALPGDLILAVVGLAENTTATVSTTTVGNVIDTPYLVGEANAVTSPVPNNGPGSTTLLSGSTFSSAGDGDPVNTGWALAQFTGAPIDSLNLVVGQIPGDGIAFSVAYVPEPASAALLSVAAVGLLRRRPGRQKLCPTSSA